MSLIREIFAGRSEIDFVPKWRVSLTVSAALVAASLALLLVRGLNLSIDFEGGGVWEVPVDASVTVADARAVLPPSASDGRIQLVTSQGSDGSLLRVQSGTAAVGDNEIIVAALSDLAGTSEDEVATSTIGPTWGEQITRQAFIALLWFFAAVAVYLAIRLEWRMAVGALAAVLHDLLITAGVYSLFGFEVSPATVIALLTILGYSLYDTVVVFDKVLENDREYEGRRIDGAQLVSRSMNQVLMRSINTTITTVLPVLSMLIIGGVLLGGASIRAFALALFVGLVLGTYSSIFLAAPLLVWLRARQPDLRREAEIEARREARNRPKPGADLDGPDDLDSVDDLVDDVDGPGDRSLIAPGGAEPRPRKKGRRR